MTVRAEYRYRALRPDGMVELGTIEAEGPPEVSRLLDGRGLLPVSIEARERTRGGSRAMRWADLALGLRLLANLLRAGLPMDRALAAFAESAPDGWRRVLPEISTKVREGRSLGSALADAETGVPALVGALVQAGEAGTGAAAAVERAADAAESVAATRAAIHQALVYPAILLVAGVLSLGFLTSVVLPRFAAILAELGQAPPATTRIVLAAAAFARGALLPAAAAIAVGLVAWRSWTARPAGLQRWHRWLLDLPVIGRARFALATARAAGAIGALLETGITLPRALGHGAAASGDAALGQALLRARDAIVQGESASRALSRESALTPTAIRLVRVGEETGRLGQMLREAGRLEHASAERLVRATVQLIEPAFIVGFGGLVGLVAAALLQALYGVRPG